MPATRARNAALVPLRPLQFALYFLAGFVPRRRDQWAFGCWSGYRFGDNAGAVFLHLDEHPEVGVRAAWITNDRAIRDRLRAEGRRAHLRWSPAGAWWTLRSGVFVYDSLPKDINYWLSRGARLVHLRHGIGIKKIERAIDAPDHRLYKLFHGSAIERAFWTVVLPWHLPRPDLTMSCSPTHASQAPWFYGVPPENVRITGFARHDRLVPTPTQDRTAIPTIGPAVPDDRPVFIYLPTFREGIGRQAFDWEVLEETAQRADITIAVKLHYVDADRGVLGMDVLSASEHLRMVDPTIDPIDAYVHSDGMISDFSSAPFDFMLLDRPVVYYVPDFAQFVEDRPLMYDLHDVAVGPICTDRAELEVALLAARDVGVGEHRERQTELRNRFHTYPPGGASERVVDAIIEEFWGRRPSGAPPDRYAYVVDGTPLVAPLGPTAPLATSPEETTE